MISIKDIFINRATEKDATILTAIAFAAKRSWNYPEHYYENWKNELTITPSYIIQNLVYNAVMKNSIVGFYSITEVRTDFMAGEVSVKKGFWLEHIFIMPEFHKSGIGRLLTDHAKETARKLEIGELWIFVDPFATGFYEKIGAEYQYESKSSIKNRLIPVYKLKTE
jgi:GNAT superfamily N-acetyltransferase